MQKLYAVQHITCFQSVKSRICIQTDRSFANMFFDILNLLNPFCPSSRNVAAFFQSSKINCAYSSPSVPLLKVQCLLVLSDLQLTVRRELPGVEMKEN